MVKESFELWTKTLVLIAATKEGRWRTQKVLWYLVSPRSPSSYTDFFPLSNTFTVFQRDEVTGLMLLWIMVGFQEQSGSSFLRRTTCNKPFPWNFTTKVLFFIETWRRVFNLAWIEEGWLQHSHWTHLTYSEYLHANVTVTSLIHLTLVKAGRKCAKTFFRSKSYTS